MKRAAFVIAAVLAVAFAGGAQAYDGRGSDNLPCDVGGYWVINKYTADVEPLVYVDGVPAQVEKVVANGTVVHLVSGPVNSATVVVYDGPGQLQLSHCIEREVPPSVSPSPSPSSSTQPSPTPSAPPSASPTPDPSRPPTSSPSPTPAPTTPTPQASLPPSPTLTPPPTDTADAATDGGQSLALLFVSLAAMLAAITIGAIEYADRRNEND